jgi:hypothetical protein
MSNELRTVLWVVLFLAFWATAATIGIWSHVTIQAMIAEVNPFLDESAKFSELGWYYGKQRRLFSEYRRLFPTGVRIRTLQKLWRMMTLLMATVAWVIVGLGGALFFAVMLTLIGWITFSSLNGRDDR